MTSAEMISAMTVTTKYSCLEASHARSFFSRAEQLRDHDRAAGCQRRKDVDDEYVEHIDQRYAGNRRFTDRGDHHRVGQTDRDGEHLLDNERKNQLFECSIGK